MYFAQLHNKSCALKKARIVKENEGRLGKNQIVLEQMQKTVKELRNIEKLNKEWANEMSRKVYKLSSTLKQEQIKKEISPESVEAE